MGNYDFIFKNNINVLNFEFVSNLYVLHIKMNYRMNRDVHALYNYIDYEVNLYSKANKNNYEAVIDYDLYPYEIKYNLKSIKQEIWCEYHLDIYNKGLDSYVRTNNILLSIMLNPSEIIVRHIYYIKYYKNNQIRFNLQKGVLLKHLNNKNYEYYINPHYIILNVFNKLIIKEFNKQWSTEIIPKKTWTEMYNMAKFLYENWNNIVLEKKKFNKNFSKMNTESKDKNNKLLNTENRNIKTIRSKGIISWIHGYNTNRFFYLSILYKNNKLIIFNHIKQEIIVQNKNEMDISPYIFIKSTIDYLINNGKLTYYPYYTSEDIYSVFDTSFKKEEEIVNIKLTILLPSFNIDEDPQNTENYYNRYNKYFIENRFKNIDIKVLTLNDTENKKDIPPVVYFIFKNWDKTNLDYIIRKKIIKKNISNNS